MSVQYIFIHQRLLENTLVYFSSFKSGMLNLLLLLGMANTPTRINILMPVKNVPSSFGLCECLKYHYFVCTEEVLPFHSSLIYSMRYV